MIASRSTTMGRRVFVRTSMLGFLAATAGLAASRAAGKGSRAVVIGHTGRGDYGHDLDLVFAGREGIEVTAVADPDPAGRAKAAARIGASRSYADYRDMLAKEKPQLVSVAMRQADQHAEIVGACLEAGAHVYCEKPFVTCPQEADGLLEQARKRGLKIAVAHSMRMMPAAVAIRQALGVGRIGELVEMRAYGKQDARAGGEDMMVLGTHLFDLMCLMAGSPVTCYGQVRQGGRVIQRSDARQVKDNVGWVAGDQVFASFGFTGGVQGTFTSAARLRETVGRWGVELHGSRGVARLNCDLVPAAFVRQPAVWTSDGSADGWKALDVSHLPIPPSPQFNAVSDWLEAIATDREPTCSGRNGALAVEMAMAVYASALTRQEVSFPLDLRTHPLKGVSQ